MSWVVQVPQGDLTLSQKKFILVLLDLPLPWSYVEITSIANNLEQQIQVI
jgi:hypothetical protein